MQSTKNEKAYTINELEDIYTTQYDERDIEEDRDDDVLNYLEWLKEYA